MFNADVPSVAITTRGNSGVTDMVVGRIVPSLNFINQTAAKKQCF